MITVGWGKLDTKVPFPVSAVPKVEPSDASAVTTTVAAPSAAFVNVAVYCGVPSAPVVGAVDAVMLTV